MTSDLLSPVLIQKLGHPIEEIRTRALHSIISKYNFDLVDHSNVQNAKLLLGKLCEWFDFEVHPHEDKVLKLMIKLLEKEESHITIRECNPNILLKKIDEIAKHIDKLFLGEIREVKELIKNAEEKFFQPPGTVRCSSEASEVGANERINREQETSTFNSSNYITISDKDSCVASPDVNDGGTDLNGCSKMNGIKHPWSSPSSNELLKNNNGKYDARQIHPENKNGTSKYSFPTKIEYFPWKPLVSTDLCVITSLYENLRYLDNVCSIQEACHFYTEILLKDFPAEIFLQRPLLVQSFFELLHSEDLKISISAGNCLMHTVKNLRSCLKSTLHVSLLNSKSDPYNEAAFQDGENYEDVSASENYSQHFTNLNFRFCKNGIKTDEEERIANEITRHQLSLSQFCFSVLSQTIPHLAKTKHAQEYNLILELVIETFSLLTDALTPGKWCEKNGVKENLRKIFALFYDPLKYHKAKSKIYHCIMVHIIVKMLNFVKPPSGQIDHIVPVGVQSELFEIILDYTYIILFPTVHSEILLFVKQFMGQRKNDVLEEYETTLEIRKSMKAAVQFLKNSNASENKLEKLKVIKKGVRCLDFHRNFQFVKEFIKICVSGSCECRPNGNRAEMRKNILIQLLSHTDDEVKVNVYKDIHCHVIRHLGVEEAARPHCANPGNLFEFLIDSDVLTEIICHGLDSPLTEIQNYSNEILVHILKGKLLFSEERWRSFIDALVPCAPLLQCYANKSSCLGRCIIKMLDPDVSKSVSLSPLDLVRGNMRLLFSKEHLIREEAMSRLTWLMTKEDPEERKLPKWHILRRVDLGSLCSSVSPQEYSTTKQVFYSVESLTNVLEMLSAESVEPGVRRSALSQISVMLEDLHLHPSFIEQSGVETIIRIFENCLIEKEYQNYPDSVVPIMKILKLLSLHNASIRLQLSQDINLYYCVLRGLLLFNGERKTRQQGVELLCLLLFHECIINVQSDKTLTCDISLPHVIVSKICLPFRTRVHWRYSKHINPSNREFVMSRGRCSKLMRISWNIEWLGGLSRVLSLQNKDLKHDIFSPSIPNDMMLATEDLESLKRCSLEFSVKNRLHDIQNATTHDAVISSLHLLHSLLILYELEESLDGEKRNSRESKESRSRVLQLPWESTLERFLLLNPCCEDDEALLFHVICTVRSLVKILKCEKIDSWVGRILTHDAEIFPRIIKSYGKRKTGLARRKLTHAVTEMLRETFRGRRASVVSLNHANYVNTVVKELQLNKDELSNISHMDWLISLLADITGTSTQIIVDKAVFNKDIIIAIMEVIIAFHCAKDSQHSFFGINIIKNCLHVLNHMLADIYSTLKGWEGLWYHALSRVRGHEEQANYCWLLSLWCSRDPVIRASAIQLVAGFTLTSRACELLMEQLHIEFEFVWQQAFQILFDESECGLAREQAALLLSNLTCHGSVNCARGFLRNLTEISFYDKIFGILDAFHSEATLNEEVVTRYFTPRSDEDFAARHPVSPPTLIAAVSALLLNIIYLNPNEVTDAIHQSGLLEAIAKIFFDAPETCDKYKEDEFVVDLIKMYAKCCGLVTKCMAVKFSAHSFILQQSRGMVDSLYSLLNHHLYSKKSDKVIDERNALWCEIFDFFSLMLTGTRDEMREQDARPRQSDGFKVINDAVTENGTDNFVSSIYLALSGAPSELRSRCTRFLLNLFGREANEAPASSAVKRVFERNIPAESIAEAEHLRWRSLSVSEKCDPRFEERICDVLLQTYSLTEHPEYYGSRKNVAIALGNLLAISEKSRKFCTDRGLADDIFNILSSTFTKLSLERLESVKKSSERKRIDPLLCEIEICFRLLTNLFIGNANAKCYASDLGLSVMVHKLWNWCLAKSSLLNATLKMLCTFTFGCESATRSLALSKSWAGFALKKSHQSTLLNSVMHRIEEAMCQPSKNFEVESIRLSFHLLENACKATECRCPMVKGTFLSSFKYVSPIFSSKKYAENDDIIEIWYNYLAVLTCYQEGQLAVTKNQDVLNAIISSVSSSCKRRRRMLALKIVRNVCLHQLNKIQLLGHYPFVSSLVQALKSAEAEDEEMTIVLHSIWALTCNSQKRKTIVRSAGFEELLKKVKKKLKLNDASANLSVIDNVLKILQNRGGEGREIE